MSERPASGNGTTSDPDFVPLRPAASNKNSRQSGFETAFVARKSRNTNRAPVENRPDTAPPHQAMAPPGSNSDSTTNPDPPPDANPKPNHDPDAGPKPGPDPDQAKAHLPARPDTMGAGDQPRTSAPESGSPDSDPSIPPGSIAGAPDADSQTSKTARSESDLVSVDSHERKPGKSGGPIHSHAPKVTMEKDGDWVRLIRVECSCGETLEIDCLYDDKKEDDQGAAAAS